jgi:XTP/dITP diphosphohydrolase
MKLADFADGIVLGTHNAKKLGELQQLLAPLGIRLQSLADFPDSIVVEETGTTFIENARLKAIEQARHLGRWTIGEDSGLCVPALDGAPGIYSARYSGPDANDAANNAKLLAEMKNLRGDLRRAYYVCTIALADPQGQVHVEAAGQCWGQILTEPLGVGGFGYDPLFLIPEYHKTFGQLTPAVKAVLSHRARALARFISQLPTA